MTNEIKKWQERVEPSIYADFVKRGYGMVHAAMFAEIAELRAKVESLAADVERYRWLRDKANAPIDETVDRFDPMVFRCHPKHPLSWDGVSVGLELDEVVDAAMAKEKA